MPEPKTVIDAVLEEASLTLEQMACACAASEEWIVARVQEGLLRRLDEPRSAWRFGAADVRRARRMLEIEQGFDATPELAALVADLLDEMDALRARLRGAGLV
jgi:chaperone modulatory protein CbpM